MPGQRHPTAAIFGMQTLRASFTALLSAADPVSLRSSTWYIRGQYLPVTVAYRLRPTRCLPSKHTRVSRREHSRLQVDGNLHTLLRDYAALLQRDSHVAGSGFTGCMRRLLWLMRCTARATTADGK